MATSLSMERLSQILNQVLAVSWRAPTNLRYFIVTVHRYSSLSPVRRLDSSRDSSLPMMTSLSPERTQSLNASSTGTSYFLSDNMSEAAAPFIREDDAGTLIPPNGAPTERLPPAYHPSWVSRNSPRSPNYIDGSVLS
jgi:hypothetical protein